MTSAAEGLVVFTAETESDALYAAETESDTQNLVLARMTDADLRNIKIVVTELKIIITDVRNENADLKKLNAELVLQIAELKNQNADMKDGIDFLGDGITDLKDELADLKSQMADLKKNEAETTEEMTDFKIQIPDPVLAFIPRALEVKKLCQNLEPSAVEAHEARKKALKLKADNKRAMLEGDGSTWLVEGVD
ncbi:hypothetical protein M0R45_010232 [Rubus argutus]|uniref:Uncharacterized protein n=1 Tax=Rubus argutus TaxID=59490 RepID=A0AAW1YA91_RUBAR